MIKLTRILWNDRSKEAEEPLYVAVDHIVWYQRTTVQTGGMSGSPKGERDCTLIAMQGYNFHVVETPEEILEGLATYWVARGRLT